jgi:hypothetical protein
MVLISLVLALHILGLFKLPVYAGRNRTWTDSLDAFAMLRIEADTAKRQGGDSRLPLFDDIRYVLPSSALSYNYLSIIMEARFLASAGQRVG